MNAQTITATEIRVDVQDETSKFGLNVIMAMSALIGVWGAACLIGGLVENGAASMLKGFLSATIGL